MNDETNAGAILTCTKNVMAFSTSVKRLRICCSPKNKSSVWIISAMQSKRALIVSILVKGCRRLARSNRLPAYVFVWSSTPNRHCFTCCGSAALLMSSRFFAVEQSTRKSEKMRQTVKKGRGKREGPTPWRQTVKKGRSTKKPLATALTNQTRILHMHVIDLQCFVDHSDFPFVLHVTDQSSERGQAVIPTTQLSHILRTFPAKNLQYLLKFFRRETNSRIMEENVEKSGEKRKKAGRKRKSLTGNDSLGGKFGLQFTATAQAETFHHIESNSFVVALPQYLWETTGRNEKKFEKFYF